MANSAFNAIAHSPSGRRPWITYGPDDRFSRAGVNLASLWFAGVSRNGVGRRLPAPSAGFDSTQMSFLVCGSVWVYKRKRPSEEMLVGTLSWPDFNRASSSFDSFARFRYRFRGPSRLDANTIWLPSGVHTGDSARRVSNVTRVSLPPVVSHVHTSPIGLAVS